LGNVGGNKNKQGGRGTIIVGNVAEKLWGASDLPLFCVGLAFVPPHAKQG
jgi:hypothetical protein